MMVKYGQGVAAHEGRQAKELLHEIGVRRMFIVERMARRKLHSDPEIADLSVRWAAAILSAEPKYAAEASSMSRFCRSLLIEFFTLGLWGDFRFQTALGEKRAIKTAQGVLRASGLTKAV